MSSPHKPPVLFAPLTVCSVAIMSTLLGAGNTTSAQVSKAEMGRAIQSRLDAQVTAWNRGDIDEFMRVYWKSPELTFSSGGKTQRGWQTTRERYKSRYPDRAAMGQLSFDQLEVTPLGDEAALVLGRWQLTREHDRPGGNFTLVFRWLDDEWVIVHDHTSSDQKDKADT